MVAPVNDDRLFYSLRRIYIEFKRKSTDRPRTVEAYENTLRHWEAIHGDLALCLIDNASLCQFQTKLLSFGLSAVTVNKECRQLQAILNRVGPITRDNRDALELLPRVPWVKPLKEREPQPRLISEQELNAIYHAAECAWWPTKHGIPPHKWWRAAIVVLYNLGCRRNSWLQIEMRNVSLERRTITITEEKTQKTRTHRMNDAVCEHVAAIWKPTSRRFLFACPRSAKRVSSSAQQLYKTWKHILLTAGIPDEHYFKIKDLRSTCGSVHYQINPASARYVLNHSSIRTTEKHYASQVPDALSAVSEQLPQPSAFTEHANKPDDPNENAGPDTLRGPWVA